VQVRLTHIDGKLPNLALMKLAHWHQSQGDIVTLTHTPSPSMFEPNYDRVYGSAIFAWSAPVVERLQAAYPDAIVGGTWNSIPRRTTEHDYRTETLYRREPAENPVPWLGCPELDTSGDGGIGRN